MLGSGTSLAWVDEGLRSIQSYVVSHAGKFLGKVIDNLGETICARICNWFNQVANLRDP